jgi:hypothetical protein
MDDPDNSGKLGVEQGFPPIVHDGAEQILIKFVQRFCYQERIDHPPASATLAAGAGGTIGASQVAAMGHVNYGHIGESPGAGQPPPFLQLAPGHIEELGPGQVRHGVEKGGENQPALNI